MKKVSLMLVVILFCCAIGASLQCMRRARAVATRHNRPSQKLTGGVSTNNISTETPSIDSDFPIPARLQKCGLLIRHIRTGGQSGATCGAHAVVNACAVQHIAESGCQLTGNQIRATAASLKNYIKQENLSDEDIYCLAKQIGLIFHLVFAFNSYTGNFYQAHHSDMFGIQTRLDDIFSMIRSTETGNYHFILNTGGHWVVVSMIKWVDQPPQLLYQDSGNGRLFEGSLGMSFINYLLRSIFYIQN